MVRTANLVRLTLTSPRACPPHTLPEPPQQPLVAALCPYSLMVEVIPATSLVSQCKCSLALKQNENLLKLNVVKTCEAKERVFNGVCRAQRGKLKWRVVEGGTLFLILSLA